MVQKNNRHFMPEKPCLLAVAVVGLLGGAALIATLIRSANAPVFCRTLSGISASLYTTGGASSTSAGLEMQLDAILHYATSPVVPQQSLAEVKISFDVLKARSPCNFLVFGLGHDSLMWASLNPGGTTLFLEEDPKWVEIVLKDAPNLRAHNVSYRTELREADDLIEMYRKEPACWPKNTFLRGNEKCKLALDRLPAEVYDKEWDLIMIDAPRGYFPAAPGRMAAIYSAAVMARNRKGSGVTDVFLHDVDRKVEKAYAEMFLCRKHMVNGAGRIWHFEIPPNSNVNKGFC